MGAALYGLILAGLFRSLGSKVLLSLVAAPLFARYLYVISAEVAKSEKYLKMGCSRQLAFIRILVCLSAFILTVVEDFPRLAGLPVELRAHYPPFGIFEMIPGYQALLAHSSMLWFLKWLTLCLLLAALLGWKTKTMLILSSIGFFLTQGILRQHTYYFHTGLAPLYLLWVLPWTPCGAAWSLDNWMRREKPADQRSATAGVVACVAVVAAIYFICGMSKLGNGGLGWLAAASIRQKLVGDAMDPIFMNFPWKPTLWLLQAKIPDIVYSLMGLVTVILELGYPSVLFSRRARLVFPVLMFCLHLGVLIFQHILFLDLLLLQLMFVDVDRLVAFICGRKTAVRTSEETARDSCLPGSVEPGAGGRGLQAWLSGVLTAMVLIWVFRIECFPVTSWQMYSSREQSRPVVYFKMVARLEDGRLVVIPRRDYSLAEMSNSRFTLARAFQTNMNGAFERFLLSYVTRRNLVLSSHSRIVRVEVQQWMWDYMTGSGGGPSRVIARRRFDVTQQGLEPLTDSGKTRSFADYPPGREAEW